MITISDRNVDIFDTPVNAVATAVKDFVLNQLPDIFPPEQMEDLEEIPSMIECLSLENFICFASKPSSTTARPIRSCIEVFRMFWAFSQPAEGRLSSYLLPEPVFAMCATSKYFAVLSTSIFT